MDSDDSRIPATGHLAMPDVAWEQAQLRARLIGELAERDAVGWVSPVEWRGFGAGVLADEGVAVR